MKTPMKRAIPAIGVFLLIALTFMPNVRALTPVAVDSTYTQVCTTNCDTGGNHAIITVPFTVGTHANRYLTVYLFIHPNAVVISATYAGQGMAISTAISTNTGTVFTALVLSLQAPTQGANNLVVTLQSTTMDLMFVSFASYFNVAPTIGADGYAQQFCSSQGAGSACNTNTVSWSIQTAHDTDYLSVFYASSRSTGYTCGAGITSQTGSTQLLCTGGSISGVNGIAAINEGLTTSAGTYTGTFVKQSLLDNNVIIIVSLSPVGTVSGSGNPSNNNPNNTLTGGVLAFLVPLLIVIMPAFLFWKTTESIFMLLIGLLIGVAIGAASGLLPVWVAFVFSLAIVAYMFRGDTGARP